MMRRNGIRRTIVLILSISVAMSAAAAEPQSAAGRPYFVFFASSIDRIRTACEAVFDSVDRQDLSASLDERTNGFRQFAGIESSRPLGMMSAWDDEEPASVIFLPVEEIDELLKTVTFEIIPFQQVAPDRFEIQRPGIEAGKPGPPYFVLVQRDYALFTESVSAVQALQVTPDQLTRGLRERYDLACLLDLKQIPVPTRTRYVDSLKKKVEPWLQPQDDEAAESAKLRSAFGRLTLEFVKRILLDTNTVTIGGKLDEKTRTIRLEVVVDAASGTPLAKMMNRWGASRSEFASLVSPDVPAGLAINLPLTGLIQQILGPTPEPSKQDSRLDAGIQLVGNGVGSMSLILALSGADAVQLNVAIPDLILRLEKSKQFQAVNESFDIHQGVVLHSLIPTEMPSSLTQLIGTDVEIIVGQGKKIVWMAIGQSETLPDRLREAIDLADESSSVRTPAPLVRARFQARQLPDLVGTNLLLPTVDREDTRQAFAKGEDGFSLVIEPVDNGIRLRIEAEEGFIRLVGRDWIKQLELGKQ